MPRWGASVHTCYGCVEIERVQEHVTGRGQTIGLVPFGTLDDGPLDDADPDEA